jgi:hypothetical protein
MKTRNLMLAALSLTMLAAASSCATLKTVEQEEIITQIQKEQATQVPQIAGRWTDANGWEYDAMGDGASD